MNSRTNSEILQGLFRRNPPQLLFRLTLRVGIITGDSEEGSGKMATDRAGDFLHPFQVENSKGDDGDADGRQHSASLRLLSRSRVSAQSGSGCIRMR